MNTVNLGVMAGLAMVSVPVVQPQARKELSEKAKREKKEAKRAVMRQRKSLYDTYLKEARATLAVHLAGINLLQETYGCQALPDVARRTGKATLGAVGDEVILNQNPYGDGMLRVKVAQREAVVLGQTVMRSYVPMPPHEFRRKVSKGETAEDFANRLEAVRLTFFRMGFSFLDGACHCPHCRNHRAVAWREYHAVHNKPENVAEARCKRWDEVSNPFAENFRYREERTSRNRVDEDGNPVPRRVAPRRWPGAGIGGETFSDKNARGGAARLVGLEVEHNRDVTGTHMWADRWSGAQVISDGSCGREAVTPPIAGENVRKCIEDLCKALNDGAAGCDSRCGLHVHVDARDMRWADMLRFLTVYCRVESFLFLIGGQNRYSKPVTSGHSYCYAVAELYGKALRSPDPKGAILAAACLGDRTPEAGRELMRNSPPGKKGNGRYKSINIMPWIAGRAFSRKDTTVEFRLHRGSHNAERIIAWAHLCQDIVHWCINATNADVDNLPKSSARALAVMSPRSKDWIIRRLLGWRAATTAGRTPIEDDVGNYKPRRIVTMKGGLYLVDATRCSYRRD